MRCDARRKTIAVAKTRDCRIWRSQMRIAFSSMASNTGPSSPGELEMTFSTSLVAVCCSSDSDSSSVRCLHLVEQPHVLDRDHRLVGKGGDQFDLLVSERPHRFALGQLRRLVSLPATAVRLALSKAADRRRLCQFDIQDQPAHLGLEPLFASSMASDQ